jgi:hypothetical protein
VSRLVGAISLHFSIALEIILPLDDDIDVIIIGEDYPLPTIHYPLPTTHYPLPTAHYPLPTTHYPLPTIMGTMKILWD